MSTPDDFRDDELSRRYRALPPELPSADADAVIRAAARQALGAARPASRQRAWLGGLAMAASVTLVMAVLLPSWRSGELEEQVAARAPAETVAEAPVPVAEAGSPPSGPAARKTMDAPVPAALSDEVAGKAEAVVITRQARNEQQEAAAPPAPSAPVQDAGMAEADAMARDGASRARDESALAARVTREQMASRKARAEVHEALREGGREDLRALAAPAPAAAAERAMPTVEALLLQDRHGEALAQLQSGPAAGDASLDSRRDLLRQLVPGADRALQCRPDSGTASARTLCRLLLGWQAGKGVPTADRQALEQALQAEGTNPQPWMQAVAHLP